MSTRSEREKKQSLNDHHKKVLAQLIAKEDNKFCADCLTKGPRWVSWNLGVFLCIRCSGIHRSLGVHISKVKSVNLDTWTNEQLVSVCQRGNGWAKDKYEANLPRDFKRPQGDSSMEYFIRDKYEKMKYSTSSNVSLRPIEEFNVNMKSPSPNTKPKEKRKDDRNGVPIIGSINSSGNISKEVKRKQTPPTQNKQTNPTLITQAAPTNQQASSFMDDLLGLNSPVSAAVPPTAPFQKATQPSDDLNDIFSSLQSAPVATPNAPSSSVSTEAPANNNLQASSKQLSKDTILSLYSQNQPNPYSNSGHFGMSGQQQMMPQQFAPFQSGYSQPQNNMGQGNMGFPQQGTMQGQQNPYNWQQQQMQQQMQNMHLRQLDQSMSYGGMRSCNSMPQMSQQQGGSVWGNQTQLSNNGMVSTPVNNHLTSSQPSSLDTLGSWNKTQSNSSGQTLSTQLWK